MTKVLKWLLWGVIATFFLADELKAQDQATLLTIESCLLLEKEKDSRQCHAKARGLNKDSTWEQISLYDGILFLKQAADFIGVEPEEVFFLDPLEMEERARAIEKSRQEEARKELERKRSLEIAASLNELRLARVRELGLRTDASWTEINLASSEKDRRRLSAELGLSPNASWEEIVAAQYKQTIDRLKKLGINLDPWWRM